MLKLIQALFKVALAATGLLIVVVLFSNLYVVMSTNDAIMSADAVVESDYDCIMVLGAGVRGGQPSPILRDRLLRGYQLYAAGVAPKILLSGDHHRLHYDEIAVMQSYMQAKGVPASDVFMDHAGLSTYQSMIRARRVFGVEKMIVVTQSFHLNRSLYLARQVGIEAIGVTAMPNSYRGKVYRNIREVLARTKDYFVGQFKPATYIDGPQIDISGDGRVTDD